MSQGRRWTVTDTAGNKIYLTEERWEHIRRGHPEITDLEAELRETLRKGRRRQMPAEPQKYRYRLAVANLPDDFTHIEAVVLFRFGVTDEGAAIPNNYVVTAYPKELP